MQGTVHALRTIAASEGASGLMRGFWPTVLSNAPFSALYYMLYSDLRRRFQKVRTNKLGASAFHMVLCGALLAKDPSSSLKYLNQSVCL